MTSNQGFELHPGAVQDITEIWEFIVPIILKPRPGSAKRS
jgi:hypothetical protein